MPSANNAAIVEISQTANKFRSSIVLQYDNKYIDVKSILGLFTTLLSSSNYDLSRSWAGCRRSENRYG